MLICSEHQLYPTIPMLVGVVTTTTWELLGTLDVLNFWKNITLLLSNYVLSFLHVRLQLQQNNEMNRNRQVLFAIWHSKLWTVKQKTKRLGWTHTECRLSFVYPSIPATAILCYHLSLMSYDITHREISTQVFVLTFVHFLILQR